MSLPFVSIIIPTYCDWHRLSLCLDALTGQTYDQSLFEVIVVNNKPDDEMPDHLILSENTRLINEVKPGSYAARNAALKIASGSIIGFTDSDCIADKDWVRNAVLVFESKERISRIGGAIHIFFKGPRPTRVELHDQIFAFPQESCVKNGYAVTGNMFARRLVFDKVGAFDDTLMSGGDYQWGIAAEKAGFNIIYSAVVMVNHPARDSLKELVKKEKRIGKGQADFMDKVMFGNREALMEVMRLAKPRTWEIKKIFDKGRNMRLSEKLSLVLLRHYIKISGDLTRIYYTWKKVDKN